MRTPDIEIAVARHFGYRSNLIVPNVSWGLWALRYEVDLLIITPSGYATEVEIKVTASDCKADLGKHHKHDSNYFRRFYFAVPHYLADCQWIPQDAGLLVVDKDLYCKCVRPARHNPEAKKISDVNINTILHLGCMRIWSLKEALNSKRQQQEIREENARNTEIKLFTGERGMI